MSTGIDHRAVPTGDGDLHVAVAGHGPGMLLVPGLLMSARRWIETGYVDGLADRFTVLAFDPLGHGDSAKPADPHHYRRDRLVAHIDAVLDHVDFAHAHVFGYSRGAGIAAVYARRRPERVTTLVHGGNLLADPTRDLAALGIDPRGAAQEQADALTAGDWGAFWVRLGLSLPDELRRTMEQRNDARAIAAVQLADAEEPCWFPPVPTCPTLAWWGTREVFHDMNLAVAEALPEHVRWSTVPGDHAGAFAARDAVLDMVVPFLETTTAA